jgi:hypothetical protein
MEERLENACNGKTYNQGGLNAPELKNVLLHQLPDKTEIIKKSTWKELESLCKDRILPQLINVHDPQISESFVQSKVIKNVKNRASICTDPILSYIDSSLYGISIKDLGIFDYDMWPIPDANYDEEEKYHLQKYVILNDIQKRELDLLLDTGSGNNWNRKKLISSLKINLPHHDAVFISHEKLSMIAALHAGSAISNKKDILLFNNLQKIIKNITIPEQITTFRTLNNDYKPKLNKNDIAQTTDIWSTSYDPISSIGYALNNPSKQLIYLIRGIIPSGFKGGVFIENNWGSIKEQHEITIAQGCKFHVDDIQVIDAQITDTAGSTRYFKAKVYYITFIV